MPQEQWTLVDQYIARLFVPRDAALSQALKASNSAGLPPISVSPNEGKFLNLIAQIRGAKRILEIGTLGGYSTIWLARALPKNGRLITLENEPRHAEIARKNIAYAGLTNIVEVHLGAALESLAKLAAEKAAAFDLTFIDADKEHNADYFNWALKLSRKGSVIIVDNVVREGKVADKKNAEPQIIGTRRFNEALAKERRASAAEIQTVGVKGYDGFAIVLVTKK